jgi:MSHA biogenesis protein MshK
MVKHMRRNMACASIARLLFIAAGCVSASALAQVDPTRPPDARDAGAGSNNLGKSALQSIMISPRRTEALIGDKLVHVGERIGSAQVMKISETEVILRDENGLQILKLFPGIEKRIIAAGGHEEARATRNSQEKSKR